MFQLNSDKKSNLERVFPLLSAAESLDPSFQESLRNTKRTQGKPQRSAPPDKRRDIWIGCASHAEDADPIHSFATFLLDVHKQANLGMGGIFRRRKQKYACHTQA